MARVLAAAEDGIHSVNGGEPSLAGRSATALVSDGEAWWAVTDGREIVLDALGPTPRSVARVDGLRANCLLPSRRGLFVGTSEARLLRLEGEELKAVAAFDQVEGRESWYTPWGGPPDTRSMGEDADGTLYINVHVGGIPVSVDGETFSPTIDVDADVHQVVAHPDRPGRAFAATAMGLAETADGGGTWKFQHEGLHATYCRAVAVAGATLLLSVSAGPRGGRAALYRRPIDGGAFERCEQGLPDWFDRNIDTLCLAAGADTSAFGTDDGRLFVSEDAGETWAEALSGLGRVQCVVLD